ncbi:Right handed beta helix region [Kaistia soli DSM 19436]|uniref:Right handed beta helix region n=1 Tax=Kaistia soli DSM 19436 TaxID=1122133 RepID=A0A1M5NF44_9HYPH|nr:right-handed parallel beta-helix repeat-containing protein [Kaistia soli]SHG88226.1 Right handed beta helix region [Kaistia soli DSM 19436]
MSAQRISPFLISLIAGPALLTMTGAAVAAGPCDQATADIYVAPDGNDAWSGRTPSRQGKDGPVATVAAAQRLLHSVKPIAGKPRIAMLRGGRYELPATLSFGPEDSGSPESPVVYCSYPAETAVLSGGIVLKDWNVQSDGAWSATVPQLADGGGYVAQLMVDGQRRYRARLPKEGVYRIVDAAPSVGTGKSVRDAFQSRPGELNPAWVAGGDAEVLTLNVWSASRYKLLAVDTSDVATVDGHAPLRPPHQLNKNRRYYLENVPGSATDPGEWEFAHFNGRLRYHPMPGETPATTKVVVPRLTRLMEIGNGDETTARVHDLVFTNLTFSDTNWVLPPGGALVNQSAASIDAAILVRNADRVTFDGVRVMHTAGAGLEFGPGTKAGLITNSVFFDLGAGAIKLGTGSGAAPGDPPGPDRVPAEAADGNRVINNLIRSGGRVHPAAGGIWMGRTSGNVVANNTIEDFYYTGISVGWTWNNKNIDSSDNIVIANRLYRIGQGLLSDMGAIYTLGASPGTIVRGNWISDVRGNTYGGTGIGLDEGSSYLTIEDNLVVDTSGPSLSINYGKDNAVRNNIFARSSEHNVTEGPPKGGRPLLLSQNIMLAEAGKSIFDEKWPRSMSWSDRNLYWSASGDQTEIAPGVLLSPWRSNSPKDSSSAVADPLLDGLETGKIHVAPASPALVLGFAPFDVSGAGAHLDTDAIAKLPAAPPFFRDAVLTPGSSASQ